ncbi:hypothetical protein V6N13_110700 [Hibiscus sabdariffa]
MGGKRLRKKGTPSPLDEPPIEPKIETDVETKPPIEPETETEPPIEPKIETEPPAVEPEYVVENEPVEHEPPIEPETEIETEPPAVEPEHVVETEPVEPVPPTESDESNEFNECKDSERNGSVRSKSVTCEFDDSDFSVEDMSHFRVGVGIYFEVQMNQIQIVEKKKKQRFPEFNSATDMDDPELKVGMAFAEREALKEGMVEGLPKVFPHSEHETCVRHLYRNFKLKFTGKAFKDALWKAARATYLREFEVCVTTALIITMLEIIRTKIMQRITKKKVEADKWCTILCPKIQKKLDVAIESSNRCWPTHACEHKFQVSCGPHTQLAMDLSEHTSSCRK